MARGNWHVLDNHILTNGKNKITEVTRDYWYQFKIVYSVIGSGTVLELSTDRLLMSYYKKEEVVVEYKETPTKELTFDGKLSVETNLPGQPLTIKLSGKLNGLKSSNITLFSKLDTDEGEYCSQPSFTLLNNNVISIANLAPGMKYNFKITLDDQTFTPSHLLWAEGPRGKINYIYATIAGPSLMVD